jgi:aspartate/methionine/tyrosine aminotransferase
MAPVEFGGEMNDGVDLYDASYKDAPYKFETGTMPIAEVIGFAKAVEYLSSFTNIQATERTLAQSAIDQLNALPGVSCITPKGAFYAFPNIAETGWKAKPLASALLEEANVAVIGGPDFGVHGEGYIRLSYANSAENIRIALTRMAEFLARKT